MNDRKRMSKRIIAMMLSLMIAATPVMAAADTAADDRDAQIAAAKAEYEAAAAEAEAAQGAVEEAKAELQESEAALEEAEADVKNAESAVVEAEKVLAGYSEDSEGYKNALNAVEAAEEKLDDAVKAADAAGEAVTEAETALAEAEAEFAAAEEYDSLAEAVRAAQAEAEAASAAFNDAEAEYISAEAEAAAAAGIMADAEVKLTSAAESVTAAKAALEAAEEDLDTAENQYESEKAEAEKAVEDAQKAYDASGMEFVLSNCIEYEDASGNTRDAYETWVEKCSENSTLSPYINDTFYETVEYLLSVDNLKTSMEFIDESNELRAQEGVGELYVSYDLMLFSAISCAISDQAGYPGGHIFFKQTANTANADMYSMLFDACGTAAAENLAWGYADPFDGWYHEEKILYDEGVRDSSVGHYESIINGNYNITGFSETTKRTSQECFGRKNGQSLTTDMFISRLDAYSADEKTALAEAEEKLASVNDDKVKAAQQIVDDMTAELEEAEAVKEQAQQTYDEAAAEHETLKAAAAAAEEKMETAGRESAAADEALEKAEKAFADFVSVNGHCNKDEAASALAAAEKTLTEAEEQLAAALEKQTAAEETLSDAEEQFDEIVAKKNEAQNALDEAEKQLESAETVAFQAAALCSEKAEELAAAEAVFKEADAERAAAEEKYYDLIRKPGDANGDDKVNVKDAVLILQYANKQIEADELDLEACYVTGDGKVNVKDAVMVLQYANKKIDGFPVEQ